MPGSMFVPDQDRDVPADDLRSAVAEDRFGRTVECGDDTAVVDRNQSVDSVIHDRPKVGFRRLALGFGPLPCAAVRNDAADAGDLSLRVSYRKLDDAYVRYARCQAGEFPLLFDRKAVGQDRTVDFADDLRRALRTERIVALS